MPSATPGLVERNKATNSQRTRDKSTRPATLERLTVNLTPRSVQALEAAIELTGDSKTDAINRAIQVYAYLEHVISNGGSIHAQKSEDSVPELLRFF